MERSGAARIPLIRCPRSGRSPPWPTRGPCSLRCACDSKGPLDVSPSLRRAPALRRPTTGECHCGRYRTGCLRRLDRNQNIPDVRHVAPRDSWVSRPKRIIEAATRLADDVQIAANCIIDHRDGRPRRFATSGKVEDLLVAIADMDQIETGVLRGHIVRGSRLRQERDRVYRDGLNDSPPRRLRSPATL